MSAQCRYCGTPLPMPEGETIPLACPIHMMEWIKEEYGTAGVRAFIAGRRVGRRSTLTLEVRLLELYYEEGNGEDFDNVMRREFGATRKELDSE